MTGLSKTKPLQHTFIKCFLLFLGRVDKCWFTKGWFFFIVSKNRHLDSCSGDNTNDSNYYGCTSVKSITSGLYWNCFCKCIMFPILQHSWPFQHKSEISHWYSLNSPPQCLQNSDFMLHVRAVFTKKRPFFYFIFFILFQNNFSFGLLHISFDCFTTHLKL